MKSVELLGILTASLLGSWHCASMCGPLAMFCMGKEKSFLSPVVYHLGRLVSYFTLFFIVISLGFPVKELAIRFRLEWGIVWAMYLLAFFWAVAIFFDLKPQVRPPRFMTSWTKSMVGKGPLWAPLTLGLTTGALPCVWLYGFIILALTQPTISLSMGVIAAFWLGTIPALSVSQLLFSKWRHNLWFRRFGPLLVFLAIAVAIARSPFFVKPDAPIDSCPMHHAES